MIRTHLYWISYPSQRPVGGRVPVEAGRGAAVVGGEDDDGVVEQAALLEARHHAAHRLVQLPEHPGEGPPILVFDVGELVYGFLGGLEKIRE